MKQIDLLNYMKKLSLAIEQQTQMINLIAHNLFPTLEYDSDDGKHSLDIADVQEPKEIFKSNRYIG